MADLPGDSAPSGRFDQDSGRMPRWVPRAIALFWLGQILTLVLRSSFARLSNLLVLLLVALFLSLAMEPAANKLAARGWKRGTATIVILLGVILALGLFVGAIGTLVGGQIADLLQNTDKYVTRIVTFINDLFGTNLDPREVNEQIQDPEGGFQEFIASQSDDALRLSVTALGGLLQAFSAFLFAFYLVADGPRLRRAICSRMRQENQERVLSAWELAIAKTGSYLYSRALLAGLSALFHWIAFTAVGVPAPAALALWVGIISQFIPVVGTYIAGVLPLVITLVNPGTSLLRALAVLIFIIVYQQVENYFFAPRITARTLEIHPAIAFGAALGGAAMMGAIGAVLALPAAAMMQAIAAEWGGRHEVVESPLTEIIEPAEVKRRLRRRKLEGSRRKLEGR
ncbi:MAG: AI-2E family transporter [Acidimicrobiia bacterium]